MKRKDFFPTVVGLRPGFFAKFADGLLEANAVLALPAPDVAAIINDARYCQYTSGVWINEAYAVGKAATASLEDLYNGISPDPITLALFNAPPLPPGNPAAVPPIPAVTPVAPGALKRIFAFIRMIKTRPGYTEAMGLTLGIVGEEDSGLNPLPTFELVTERSGGCECVKVVFKKYGRQGVVIFSRRAGGQWEMLAIDLGSPYNDEREVLVAGQPEVREYRLQFYDDSSPTGDFTPVQSVTVTP